MSMDVAKPPEDPRLEQIRLILALGLRGLSLILLALGVYQWAIIMGALRGRADTFITMSAEWRLATMNLAVADLLAGVGLWMRVAWGNVIWIYAALFEVAMHTIFRSTFGDNFLIVGFHVLTLGVFAALLVAEQRLSPSP